MNEPAQNVPPDSLARFRRKPFLNKSRLVYPLTYCLEIFGVRSAEAAGTPLPNLDDDLSVQRFISDRRVIGVRRPPLAHPCSHYFSSTTLSFSPRSFATKSNPPNSPSALLPPLVTMLHACLLVTTIECLSLLALVRSILRNRRFTTHDFSKRGYLPGQISS
jgi:hypothetical protein